jgi:hypothetical protein
MILLGYAYYASINSNIIVIYQIIKLNVINNNNYYNNLIIIKCNISICAQYVRTMHKCVCCNFV